MSIDALALTKGTASFGLARGTGTVAIRIGQGVRDLGSARGETVAVEVSRGRRDMSLMWRVGPDKVRESSSRGGTAVCSSWTERVEHRCQFDMRHGKSSESITCIAEHE